VLQRLECLDLKLTSCGFSPSVLEHTIVTVARDNVELLLVSMRPKALSCRRPSAGLALLDAAYPTEELGGEVLSRHLRRVALSEYSRA
jgi:hypothetical protein